MDTELFDYELPPEQIAQVPARHRDQSRLLCVNRESGEISHHIFRELPNLLPKGSRLFRNVASVLKARLSANLPTGGKVECLLLNPAQTPEEWWCLLKPGRKLQPGRTFKVKNRFTAEVLEKNEDGQSLVRFKCENDRAIDEIAEELGKLPLPPYIGRQSEPQDTERYQTVYADHQHKIAAAAPTAGLHFTERLVSEMQAQGFAFHDLLLRVGLGTFKPIQSKKLEDHPMHSELYKISEATFLEIQNDKGAPRVAVGTTSVRTIEDALRKKAKEGTSLTGAFSSEANLFLYPPEEFLGVDALITNFHLPRSTLLCLVSAFLTPRSTDGIEWLKKIYAEALREGYRFYSYGDAMLIL